MPRKLVLQAAAGSVFAVPSPRADLPYHLPSAVGSEGAWPPTQEPGDAASPTVELKELEREMGRS
jgi:hypothetical protein